MAMEDGVCLSMEMAARPDDHEAALVAYQDRRRVRTARIQLTSREIGDHIYHPSGVHAALRNAIMSSKSDAEWYDVLDWLYGAQHSDAASAVGAARATA
jgi:salicylate hydroxylase